VGAWLGFNVTDGLLALVTTIAGAAVGGNLLLVVRDMASARRVRERVADSSMQETLDARPLTG
jgi:hypothetical protein